VNRELADAFEVIGREFGKSLDALSRGLTEFFDSPGGQQIKELVAYYAAHPEELERLVGDQERAANTAYCHCFCQWHHHGDCLMVATSTRLFNGVSVPMCPNCAAASDRRRAIPLEGPAPGDHVGPD
jgi:hypothetical protein